MRRYKSKHFFAFLLAFAMLFTTVFPGTASYAAEVKTTSGNELAEKPTAPIFEKIDDEEVSDNDIVIKTEEAEEENAYEDDDVVRVFIVFEDEAVVEAGYSTEDIAEDKKAMAYSDELTETQDEVIEKIEEEVLEGESLDTRYSFTLLTNAVSAEVAYGDLEEIENVDGVSAVYVVPIYQPLDDTVNPLTMTSGDMVGSYPTWASGYSGAGMRVAILDTGLDIDHPSFTEGGFLYGLNETAEKNSKSISDYNLLGKEEIESVADRLNAKTMRPDLTADNTYLGAKIPFAFNYADENFDPTHKNDDQGDHGSHVAGIATANKYVPNGDGYSTQKLGVVGTAPDAQVFVMKVFGKGGKGAATDDYMAAMEDAILLGADTINLSLGSSSAGESTAAEAYVNNIMNRLSETNTVVCISAGNSANFSENSKTGLNFKEDVNADTVGSPGSYTNAFTAASAVNTSVTGYMFVAEGVKAFYLNGNDGINAPFADLAVNGQEKEYDYIFIKGIGVEEDYANIDVSGKIVFVSRGSSTFSEKHDIATAHGAIATVVYNNTDGTLGMTVADSKSKNPCVGITLATALAIADASEYDEATNTYSGKLTVYPNESIDFNVPDGYLMSDFSSWGVPGDLSLKPEITAPGGNIYSTLDKGQYGVKSGTSMASPSLAGLTALVIQYIEENDLASKTGLSTRALAQSLLMSTSVPLVQKDGEIYSPRKQGSGLANAYAAINTPAYITVGSLAGNDGKVKIELGDDPARTGKYSFDFTVNNLSGEKAYYRFDSNFVTESVIEDTFIANSSHRLNPNVTIKTDSEQYLYDVDGNGKVNIKDAYALLKVLNNSADYSIVASFEDAYDFNKNGILDTDDVNSLMKAIACPRKASINLKEKVFVVKNKANVNVSVALSKEDRAYLESNFVNGMFVEGFVILDGSIDLSVPVLAFYGDWSDSSMYEPFDIMKYFFTDEEQFTYSGISRTNFLTAKMPGSSKNYIFSSNMYEDDEEYIADRNAIAPKSGFQLTGFTYSLIRNAASVKVKVTDAETGEVYYEKTEGGKQAAYYESSSRSWKNTSANIKFNWAGTNAEGKALSNDTKVNVSLTAVPSYYKDGKVPAGKGLSLTYPFVIDTVAPTAKVEKAVMPELDVSGNAVTEGSLTISVEDNRYVSAVYLVSKDKSELLASYPVNQKNIDDKTVIEITPPHTVFFLTVVDYAGNRSMYRVNMSGIEDTDICDSITLSDEILVLAKEETAKLTAEVGPLTLSDTSVTWSSSDESVVTVDEEGIVTAVGKGEAVVTATTVAKNKDGESLTADCEVLVIGVNTDLNAIVYDENSEIYFSTINTETFDINKISAKQAAPYSSVAAVDGYLYAFAESQDNLNVPFYKIDANTFEATEIEATGIRPWATDVAYGKATKILLGTYQTFLIFYDMDGQYTNDIGLSSYTDGDALVGITYYGSTRISRNETADIFYLITSSGKILRFLYTTQGRLGLAVIGETEIDTNGLWYYQSFYYDAETGYFFYSVYNDDADVDLYAMLLLEDPDTGDEGFLTFKFGTFGEKIWPISGLYRWEQKENDVNDESIVEDLENSALSLGRSALSQGVKKAKRVPSLAETPIITQPELNAVPEVPSENATVSENDTQVVEEENTENEVTNEAETETGENESEESVSGNE